MKKDPELKVWPRCYCDELPFPALHRLGDLRDGCVVVLMAITVKYAEGAVIVIEASFRKGNDAQGVRAVGRHDLDIRATESVVQSQTAEVVGFGFRSFADNKHPIVGLPHRAAARVRPGGSATRVHQSACSFRI